MLERGFEPEADRGAGWCGLVGGWAAPLFTAFPDMVSSGGVRTGGRNLRLAFGGGPHGLLLRQ